MQLCRTKAVTEFPWKNTIRPTNQRVQLWELDGPTESVLKNPTEPTTQRCNFGSTTTEWSFVKEENSTNSRKGATATEKAPSCRSYLDHTIRPTSIRTSVRKGRLPSLIVDPSKRCIWGDLAVYCFVVDFRQHFLVHV